MRPKISIALIVTVLAVAISFIWFSAHVRGGEFATLTPRFDGTCTDFAGLPGAEDGAAITGTDLAVVSYDDRRGGQNSAIAIVSFSAPNPIVANFAAGSLLNGKPFHGHGLSIFTGPDGAMTLMVVNHPNGYLDSAGTKIEIFTLDKAHGYAPVWQKSVPLSADGQNGFRANDVAAISASQFYVTQELIQKMGSLDEYIAGMFDRATSGAVYFYDGANMTKVASDIGYANSVALSNDGKKLYVTGTLDRRLRIYDRNRDNNQLTLVQNVLIGTGLDNITVDEENRLWIASHPKLFTFLDYVKDAKKTAPNQIIIAEPAEGTGGKIDQVLLDLGDTRLSGATFGLRHGNRLLMGGAFSPNMRLCQLPEIWHQSQSHPAQRLIDPDRDAIIEAADKAKEEKAKAAQEGNH